MVVNVPGALLLRYTDTSWEAYLRIFGERLLSMGVPIASLGAAWKLLRRPPAKGVLAVVPENDMASDAWQGAADGRLGQ